MKRIKQELKKKPGPNFLIFIPIRFSTSSFEETYETFKKLTKANNTNTVNKIREELIKLMDFQSFDELFYDDIEIRKSIIKIKERITELSTNGKIISFSSVIEEIMKAYNDENKK